MRCGDLRDTRALFKAVTAANIDLHPVFGVALKGLAIVGRVLPAGGPHVDALLNAHALDCPAYAKQHGQWLPEPPAPAYSSRPQTARD